MARKSPVSLPELGLLAATRVLLGLGIGLLISDRFNRRERTALGRALAATGALTTIPFLLLRGRKFREELPSDEASKLAA